MDYWTGIESKVEKYILIWVYVVKVYEKKWDIKLCIEHYSNLYTLTHKKKEI